MWSQKKIDEILEKQINTLKSLTHTNYYHPSLNREQAEKQLIDFCDKNQINGCFLIRPKSNSSNDYSLSVLLNRVIDHHKIKSACKYESYYFIKNGPLVHGIDQLINFLEKQQYGNKNLQIQLPNVFLPGEKLPAKTRIHGYTNLLHEAVSEIRELDKLKKILNSPFCPDIDERNEEGRTALDIACEYDYVDAMKEIIKKKPSLNLCTIDGFTPLHRAVENNSVHSIYFLLIYTDIDPTMLTIDGLVPLHVAAANNNFVCVKMLLKHKVPDKPRTITNKTPLDLAIENNCEETIEILLNYKPQIPITKSLEWLHENFITREKAFEILSSAITDYKDNVFLVRTKENNVFILSLLSLDNEYFNFLINFDKKCECFYIDDGPLFVSLEHLIEHYMKYADGLPFKLKYPIGANSKYTRVKTENSSLSEIKNENKKSSLMHCVYQSGINKIEISDQVPRINKSDLNIENLIYDGKFSKVYIGTFKKCKKIAIKLLKDFKASNDFISEINIMRKLMIHPNIVRLLGYVNENGEIMMIQELMLCSLLDKLLEMPRKIGDENLKKWIFEIVNGMKFMESKKIVHRNLASRNILLGPNLEAKISDFGLSRVYENDEYTQKTDRDLPIKWYAPESIERGRYTSKSDVWSFGVTVWEMWTYGNVPYGEKTSLEVYQFLKLGYRLRKPKDCLDFMYNLMKQCWEWNEETRPSFQKIKDMLSQNNTDYS